MRHYETMFVLKPTLTQEDIDSKIEFFKNILTNNEAVIDASLNMGMRTLAYEIKKHTRGYYYVIYFKAPPTLVKELERNYRITEDILRFIVIKYENKREQEIWNTLVDRANGKVVESKKKLRKVVENESVPDNVNSLDNSRQSDVKSIDTEEKQVNNNV